MYNFPENKSLIDLEVLEKVVLIHGYPEKPQPWVRDIKEEWGVWFVGFQRYLFMVVVVVTSLCFQTARCLVCIMDLCSNSRIYLCSHLNVAAKHEFLKEKKRKERGEQGNAGINLSIDEEWFLLCVQKISLSSTRSSQRACSVQCILMELSEVQRYGEKKNLDLW